MPLWVCRSIGYHISCATHRLSRISYLLYRISYIAYVAVASTMLHAIQSHYCQRQTQIAYSIDNDKYYSLTIAI
jgi:hypothetical protein